MRYKRSEPGAIEQLTSASAQNSALIAEALGSRIERIERLIDIEFHIAAHFVWMFDTGLHPRTDAERTAFSLFQKIIIGGYDALDLLRRGAFGSARLILRQILEALVIGKFCALSEDETMAIKWQSGKQIYLGKEVFRKILKPDMAPVDELWSSLSDYTHASLYAQQRTPVVTDDIEWKELTLTFIYFELLLECNYHLLNSYIITSGMVYFASNYRDPYTVPELRSEARALFRETRSIYGPGAMRLLTTFKRKWLLKPVNPVDVVRSHRTVLRRLSDRFGFE